MVAPPEATRLQMSAPKMHFHVGSNIFLKTIVKHEMRLVNIKVGFLYCATGSFPFAATVLSYYQYDGSYII